MPARSAGPPSTTSTTSTEVALPAVAFFNLFVRMIKARLGRGNALASEVLAFLKSNKLPKEGPFRSKDDAPAKGEEA